MAAKMTAEHLLRDELLYEIGIRTDVVEGGRQYTVDELRKKFKELDIDAEFGDASKLDAHTELTVCEAKLEELAIMVKVGSSERRFESRCMHVLWRLERIHVTAYDLVAKRHRLLALAVQLKSAPAPAKVEEKLTPSVVVARKEYDIAKWGVWYDAKAPLYKFLIRVEELAFAHSVSDAQLLRGAVHLFRGEPLNFYRNIRDEVRDWKEFIVKLKLEFQPVDYERRLLMEIQQKLQNKDERVGAYLDRMQLLFGQLTDKVSEKTKVEIIKRNLNTFYISKLTLVKIDTIKELKDICVQFEVTKYQCENRGYASVGRDSVIDDSPSGSKESGKKIYNINKSVDKIMVKCLKCMGNHHFTKCMKVRGICCFHCKRTGVLTRDCQCRQPSNSKNE